MSKRILLLGGYGGVGRPLFRLLLQETDAEIIVAGRNEQKAKDLAIQLNQEFPDRKISHRYADASRPDSLSKAFEDIHLVLLTATTPEWATQVAETAVESGADYLDILFRSDVAEKLMELESKVIASGRLLIPQGGFHPGLPAPFVKAASHHFDEYDTAEVSMAMAAKFEKADSAKELVYESGVRKPSYLKNGVWKVPTYKDVVKIRFSERFGLKDCYPIYMPELIPLEKELGIRNMGCYAAGFNWLVDYVVFPIIMVFQSIKHGLALSFLSSFLVWCNNVSFRPPAAIEFRLRAKGTKNGKAVNVELVAYSEDAYAVTGIAVVACVKQYLQGKFKEPGIFRMGNIVEPQQVLSDMKKMGVRITERVF